MRSRLSSTIAAVLATISAAFPAAMPMPYASARASDPYARNRSRHTWNYPFASARQNARRYISVVGRNGHATMQRVK